MTHTRCIDFFFSFLSAYKEILYPDHMVLKIVNTPLEGTDSKSEETVICFSSAQEQVCLRLLCGTSSVVHSNSTELIE